MIDLRAPLNKELFYAMNGEYQLLVADELHQIWYLMSLWYCFGRYFI